MSSTEVTTKPKELNAHSGQEENQLPSIHAKSMKAIINENYGLPKDLRLCEIKKPIPNDREVLVRNYAAALHIGDSFAIRGTPLLMRMATGLFKPTYGVPGFDFSGIVEDVGKDVSRFKPGDEVFGECDGSCAEYLTANEDKLAFKPTNLTFEHAAALTTSGLAALHALRDVASLQSKQSVLINGASGGVGTFAVQIAKSLGAVVTGVCSSTNVELLKSIGADHVIDYTKDDYTRSEIKYDVIFDNVENRPLSHCRRVLKPHGTLVLNSGTGAKGLRFMSRLFMPLILNPFVRQNLKRYLSVPNQNDLNKLKRIVEAGSVTPVIDRIYQLADVPKAIHYIESGHVKGKVVIEIAA